MKIKALSIISLIILGVLLFSNSAFAELSNFAPKNPSEYQIAKVAQECKNLKRRFMKIRSTDAFKRVSLGGIFERVSNELMAKLNSRIVLNKMNSVDLVAQSANFDSQSENFRTKYRSYERELTKLTDMDCNYDSAREFYIQIEKVRFLREELNSSVIKARELAYKYKELVKKFKMESEL